MPGGMISLLMLQKKIFQLASVMKTPVVIAVSCNNLLSVYCLHF